MLLSTALDFLVILDWKFSSTIRRDDLGGA
jgi:hypothetical protein